MFQLLPIIATVLALALTVVSTGLLVPLYAWPGIDAWNTIYDSIAAHPSIPFYLIINPSTGPGDTEYPEEVFITAIAKLNSYSNANDIATYAKWVTYTGKNIRLSGIFFDEAANGEDPSKLAYFENLSRKSKAWFAAADFIVEYENTYANWVALAPDQHFSTPGHYEKSAVILNQTPGDADVDEVVRLANDMGLGAIYLASDDDYMSLSTVPKVAVAFAQSRSARRRGYGQY
ncbi:hypothetical protein N7465_006614 [Penicillium sp. CMV-2018d]|nr:hypothetical protein N7465_006614 [Penicillium sp. CMV-2018d]